ncbi:MAG: hypothetical protein AAGF11_19430 [Myxococcota bacterium]
MKVQTAGLEILGLPLVAGRACPEATGCGRQGVTVSTALLLLLLLGEPAASAEGRAVEPEASVEAQPTGEPGLPSEEPPTDEPSSLPEPPQPPVLPDPPGSATGELPGPGPGELRWSAPSGCPTPDELRDGIERRLGRELTPGEAQVDARVEPYQGGYRLTLRTTTGDLVDGRTLDADDCGALADATALIVALAVDPVAVAGALELWRAAEAQTEAQPAPILPGPTPARRSGPADRPAESEPTPPAKERGLAGGVLRLTGGVGLGAVPGATGALSLAGGLRWRRARLELEGGYWIPRRSEAIDGARVRVQLGTAGVRGCGVLSRDRLEAPLCGGVQLGGMRGAGEGTPDAQVAQGLWFALEAGVGLSWWFAPRWALAGGFSAAVPLVQPGFDLDTDPPVRLFEPSSVAGRLWLGIELRLNSP